jgi:pyruvate/2-oxoglutarate dehydrogenase complex dihydrolipoamide acyltransferase (E2) component
MKPYYLPAKNKFFLINALAVETEIHPQYTATLSHLVNLENIEQLRNSQTKEDRSSYTAILAKAIALALEKYPYANQRVMKGWWWKLMGRRLQKFNSIDIAYAVERNIAGAEGFSFVDILRDLKSKNLEQISNELRSAVNESSQNSANWNLYKNLVTNFPVYFVLFIGKLACYIPSIWMRHRGGAVLISSPGKYGVHAIFATWPWPVGFSFGRVEKRPIVFDDEIKIAPTFMLTLNFDRRIMAGAPASHFFMEVVNNLENCLQRN